MISSFNISINKFFKHKSSRTTKILKNVIFSFGIKGGSILIGLLLIPMTINYVNPVKYGIWLTISSIVSWMSFFDIGLGNGLRNKLTEALALDNHEVAQKYVSTTYLVLTGISVLIFVLFSIVNPYLNWFKLLNIPGNLDEDLQAVLLIVVGSFCIQFIVQTINVILSAIQEPAKVAFLSFIGQLLLLVTIFYMKENVPGSLSTLVLALTLIPIAVLVMASIFLFNSKLKFIAPNFRKIDFKKIRNILSLGSSFFIIQIGALILFQTDNIVLTRIIGPQAVTEFNVVHKLFAVVTMGFTIIVTPYWSAFTDAYTKNEFDWLKANLKLIRKLWLIISLLVIPTICLSSKWIFEFWLGNSVNISWPLTISMGFYVVGITAMMLNCYFLNGIGKLRIQLILYLIICLINIPLAIFLCKILGVSGVVYSNVIMFFLMNIILWIQCNKIVNKKAHGLWDK